MRTGLISDEPIQIMFTDVAILLGMVYVYLPLMVLPLYASIEKFDFRWPRLRPTFTRGRAACCGASSCRW